MIVLPIISPPIFYSKNYMSQQIFCQEELKFNRLNLDYIKKNDLRSVFEILMSEPESRTIADVNSLVKIFLNIEPIKLMNNFSAIYHVCRNMFLAKFKEKSFIYQKQEDAQCLYLIINGKIGLYKRTPDLQDQEEVVFLSEGNCFGSIYNWKHKFLPLTFEETLLAIIPRRQINRITLRVAQQREEMYKTIKRSKIFGEEVSQDLLRSASQYFTLNRVPFGTYLIKQGQIPKALFFLLKGTVKKQLQMRTIDEQKIEIVQKKELSVASYSSGDHFPKENLSECLSFNIIAESPCEVITIPKKALKILHYIPKICESSWKTQQYYRQQIKRQQSWRRYKTSVLSESLNLPNGRSKPMSFKI